MPDYDQTTDLGRFGLGRLPAEDERDNQYLLSAPFVSEIPAYKYYSTGPILDQGAYPHCVGYAWRQWLSSAILKTRTGPSATVIYTGAQKLDEWPGENYAGTSVRGGAKLLQSLGHIDNYFWAFNADTIKTWILSGQGTVVVGTNWYEDMFRPDVEGFLHPTGPSVGGHAYLLAGYSQDREAFRIVNSWGRSWGDSGRAWISFQDFDTLIRQNGEACTAYEKKVP